MTRDTQYKTLNIQGTDYQTLFTKKFENRVAWKKQDPKKVKNLIPGTVMELYVRAGGFIAEGEALIDLEAMKMINRISAPFSGIIKDVYVHPGQALSKGTVMVEYE